MMRIDETFVDGCGERVQPNFYSLSENRINGNFRHFMVRKGMQTFVFGSTRSRTACIVDMFIGKFGKMMNQLLRVLKTQNVNFEMLTVGKS